MRLFLLYGLLFLGTTAAIAAIAAPHNTTRTIARTSNENFLKEGFFEGGRNKRAVLESLRLADRPEAGFERWVIDFSDPVTKKVGSFAPLFQLQYFPAEKFIGNDGSTQTKKAAKFLFLFRSITRNKVDEATVKKLAKKSRFVKDILLYPPIEEGDLAMEFVLKDNVLFEPHQPVEKEGRLVLDLRPLMPEPGLP